MGMKYSKPAGVVFTFNRPDYLAQTLDSLLKNDEARDMPWYAFLDGAVNEFSGNRYAKGKEIKACHKLLLDSPLKFSSITVNENNECIARQKHKAHRLYAEHDVIYFFEDDMIVSPHYLKLLRIALQQYPRHAILLHTGKSKGRLDRLVNCNIARIWGYGMTRVLYSRIEQEWNEFHKGISKIDYLLRSSMSNIRMKLGIKWHSHDVTITQLSRKRGAGKLWPEVSRGYYIGRKGSIAFRTDATWFKRNMHKQKKRFVYSSDANFTAWRKA